MSILSNLFLVLGTSSVWCVTLLFAFQVRSAEPANWIMTTNTIEPLEICFSSSRFLIGNPEKMTGLDGIQLMEEVLSRTNVTVNRIVEASFSVLPTNRNARLFFKSRSGQFWSNGNNLLEHAFREKRVRLRTIRSSMTRSNLVEMLDLPMWSQKFDDAGEAKQLWIWRLCNGRSDSEFEGTEIVAIIRNTQQQNQVECLLAREGRLRSK